MMSNCSILRIGPIDSENGNAAKLRSAIASHFHQDTSSWSPSSDSNNSNNNTNNNLLTISNRYFDANVLLVGLDDSINNEETTAAAISHHQEDGIVLIFDSSPPLQQLLSTTTTITTFDSLDQHHTTATTTITNNNNQECSGELLRLCIGTTHGPSPLSDGSKKSEEEYSRRVLWCLDRGYEYIEVDLTSEGLQRGFDERDKDGFARVIEAVETCMWSSHVMKTKRNVVGGGGGIAGLLGLKKDGDLPTKNLEGSQQSNNGKGEPQTEGTTIPSSPTTIKNNDAEREKAAMASLLEGVTNNEQSLPSTTAEVNTDNNNNNTPAKEEETKQQPPQPPQQEEMIAFHQLDSVLTEAKRIRESSKNNSMSDEERRERAGDTAMKLMGLLDSLGFDEGGSDTDDDNGGSCSSSEG
ncbi:hypothetical protein ACHAXR_001835 [Thalassiosira sp. AJA248-18]